MHSPNVPKVMYVRAFWTSKSGSSQARGVFLAAIPHRKRASGCGGTVLFKDGSFGKSLGWCEPSLTLRGSRAACPRPASRLEELAAQPASSISYLKQSRARPEHESCTGVGLARPAGDDGAGGRVETCGPRGPQKRFCGEPSAMLAQCGLFLGGTRAGGTSSVVRRAAASKVAFLATRPTTRDRLQTRGLPKGRVVSRKAGSGRHCGCADHDVVGLRSGVDNSSGRADANAQLLRTAVLQHCRSE